MEEAAKALEQLRKERDEARRIACRAMSSGGWDRFFKLDPIPREALEEANLRGWDCFENHVGDVTEMVDPRIIFFDEVAQLRDRC
jgi:hypothetical protein